MATTTKKKQKKSAKQRERRERRFVAQSAVDTGIVRLVGAIGAALLGGGAWGQFYRPTLPVGQPLPYAYWLLAAGAILTGIALWIGSSNDPALRVGDGGLALDKGEIVRIPWHSISRLRWDENAGAIVVNAKDENDRDVEWKLTEKTYPDAIGWVVREAFARVPNVVEIDADRIDALDHVDQDAGELLRLEPLQVVGHRDAISGRIIAYEPDGRVCSRCERVYYKTTVPDVCACGASLAGLGSKEKDADAEPSVSAAAATAG